MKMANEDVKKIQQVSSNIIRMLHDEIEDPLLCMPVLCLVNASIIFSIIGGGENPTKMLEDLKEHTETIYSALPTNMGVIGRG